MQCQQEALVELEQVGLLHQQLPYTIQELQKDRTLFFGKVTNDSVDSGRGRESRAVPTGGLKRPEVTSPFRKLVAKGQPVLLYQSLIQEAIEAIK